MSVETGDKFEVKCNAGGSPQPKIYWFKKTAAGMFISVSLLIKNWCYKHLLAYRIGVYEQ